MKKLNTLMMAAGLAITAGCASIMDGSTDTLMIHPMSDGIIMTNATCTATNSKGSWVSTGGSAVSVKKARGDLMVSCVDNDNTSNQGSAVAPRNTQIGYMIANFFIWDLCTISCIVDFSTGAIYNYQDQLVVPMRGATSVKADQVIQSAI